MRILITLLLLLFALPGLAYEIEEFEDGFGEFEYSPQKIGQGTTDGWVIVTNAGEKAARNSTTGTKATYYWKLTREVDLTNATDPMLDVKYHFKGYNYDYAQVQIGPQGATRLSQFTTLKETTEATASPEEHMIDLSAWAGQVVTIRILLRKPSDITENRIGLYVHRIGVSVADTYEPAPPDPTMVAVGAFNIQVFGLSKMDKPDVPEVLVETAARYDLLLIQEIRDSSGVAIQELLDLLNASTDNAYAMIVSDRLGRTSSKEQYAFFYRPAKLKVLDSYHYDDGVEPDADLFQREPFLVWFSTIDDLHTFVTIPLHSAPDQAVEELGYLSDVYDDAVTTWGDPDAMLLGDFNAGCTYATPTELESLSLWTDQTYSWWIPGEADTTTSSTVCPYDRILTTGNLSTQAVDGSQEVFLFDQALAIGPELTRAVSDHYPVEVLFELPAE